MPRPRKYTRRRALPIILPGSSGLLGWRRDAKHVAKDRSTKIGFKMQKWRKKNKDDKKDYEVN